MSKRARDACGLRAQSEAHVQTAAQEICVERNIAVRSKAAIEAAIESSEIDIEIFGLKTHVAHDAHFDPCPDRPADVGDAATGKSGTAGVDVSERNPDGYVRQKAIECVTKPAAHRGQPVVAGRAAKGTKHSCRSFYVRPIDVAFRAEAGNWLRRPLPASCGRTDTPADACRAKTANHSPVIVLTALYESQVRLLRLLVSQSPALLQAGLTRLSEGRFHLAGPDPLDIVVEAPSGLRQRECLVLRYYLDLTEAEIAATLGISAGSVKTHAHRGLAALAARLEGS